MFRSVGREARRNSAPPLRRYARGQRPELTADFYSSGNIAMRAFMPGLKLLVAILPGGGETTSLPSMGRGRCRADSSHSRLMLTVLGRRAHRAEIMTLL